MVWDPKIRLGLPNLIKHPPILLIYLFPLPQITIRMSQKIVGILGTSELLLYLTAHRIPTTDH